MFVSIGLFSIENGVTGSERFSKKEKDITPAKVKKSFKHVSRYSNLC